MKKNAEKKLYSQIGRVLVATTPDGAAEELSLLLKLADILDQMGSTKDADHVDKVAIDLDRLIKQSQWWANIMGGGAGALKSLWERSKGGEELFSKKGLVDILTEFLLDTGLTALSSELVDVVEEHIPGAKWFVDKTALNIAIKGALTYAVRNSDFVSKLVDGIKSEVGKVFGLTTKQEENKTPQPAPAQPSGQQKAPPVAQQQPGEGSDTQSFQVAAPGAKA